MYQPLLRHGRWADARVVESVRALAPPPAEAVRLVAHLAATARLYLARMRGDDPWPQHFWPELSLDEAEALLRATTDDLAAWLARQDAAALARPVSYRNSRGTRFATPPAEMLLHLALHGEHHRGQIARIVRAAGGAPALTDWIVFVREMDTARPGPT